MVEILFLSAAVLGLAGSTHCVGMCGPIALSLPLSQKGSTARVTTVLLYFLGKALTYSLLGLLFGILGEQLALAGWQRMLSIVLGLAMLWFALATIFKPAVFHQNIFTNFLSQKLAPLMARFMSRPGYQSWLGLGLLNGLLPCGLVYVALSAAVATGSVWLSGAFMLVFGLATMPLMLFLILFANQLNAQYRSKMRRWLPVFTAVIAVLLILRGLNLDIPYVSPYLQDMTDGTRGHEAISCH